MEQTPRSQVGEALQEMGEGSALLDHEHGVQCEFRCASLLDTPTQMLQRAAAVVMEVCLPLEVQREASKRLQSCQSGCSIVSHSAPVMRHRRQRWKLRMFM